MGMVQRMGLICSMASLAVLVAHSEMKMTLGIYYVLVDFLWANVHECLENKVVRMEARAVVKMQMKEDVEEEELPFY